MEGLIVKTHNRFYHVLNDGVTRLCSPKGNFRTKKDPEYRLPVIGDRVMIDPAKGKKGVEGYIVDICKRRNRLVRTDFEGRRVRVMAANLDRAMVVSAISEPGVDFSLIDRYLLTCELAHIDCTLVINKIDLDPQFTHDPRLQAYRDMDIPIIEVSAKTGQGMDELNEAVSHGISYLTGASGVGKSSLVNFLAPEAEMATGTVDPKKGQGRHTTTYSALVAHGEEGYLVDSPGLREFYPPRVDPDQVRFGFHEIAMAQRDCRFSGCLHDGEPGCAIMDQVEKGDISSMRYKSYLNILQEMLDYAQNRFS